MKSAFVCVICLISVLAGCSSDGKPSIIPNPDPTLNKTAAEFASDAAKRSYEATAPKGGTASARASYELDMIHHIDLVNLSDTDWTNVEVWLNQKYVVFLPSIQNSQNTTDAKHLDFAMFFDQTGHHFDTEGGKNPITTLEIYRDGKMYTVPTFMQ